MDLDLRNVEERLMRERLECEMLEDQIRTLHSDSRGKDEKSSGAIVSSRGHADVPLYSARAPEDSGSSVGRPSAPGRWGSTGGGVSVGRVSTGTFRRSRSASPLHQNPAVLKAITKPTMGVGDRFKTARVPDPGPGSYNAFSSFSPATVQVQRRTVAGGGPPQQRRALVAPDEAVQSGLATETDIEVASFALRHTLSAAAVTEVLELIQRASLRSKDEDEPFALTHRALRSRVASVAGLAGESAAREADGASKREKQLRLDLSAAQRNMQQYQQSVSAYQLQTHSQMVQLREHIASLKADAIESVKHISSWKQLFEQVTVAYESLRKCFSDNAPLFEHSAHVNRFRDMQSRLRALDEALSSADMLLTVPTAKPSLAASVAPLSAEKFGKDTLLHGGLAAHSPGIRAAAEDGATAADSRDGSSSVGQVAFDKLDVANFAARTQSTLIAEARGEHEQVAVKQTSEKLKAMYGLEVDGVSRRLVHTSESKPAKRVKSPLKRLSSDDGSATPRTPLTPGSSSLFFASPPQEETILDVLRKMFQFFTAFGDRRNTQLMTDFKFYKLVRLAKITDSSLTERDIDQVFTKVVSKSHNIVLADGVKRPSATASGRRMTLDEFVQALGELGIRKFGATMTPSEAFKELFVRHLLPLKERFAGMTSIAPVTAPLTSVVDTIGSTGFLDRLCQPDVIAFLNENRESLQALFLRFAMDEVPTGAMSWESVRDSNATLSEKEFIKFCVQLGIMPDKVSRPDLVSLFRRATQEFADEGIEEALSYPEFIELLAGVAEFAFKYEPPQVTLLQKLHMLLFHMSDSGFKFQKREFSVFQNVRRIVKQTLKDKVMEESKMAHHEAELQAQIIKDVLLEKI